jgi:hypothetical protein
MDGLQNVQDKSVSMLSRDGNRGEQGRDLTECHAQLWILQQNKAVQIIMVVGK